MYAIKWTPAFIQKKENQCTSSCSTRYIKFRILLLFSPFICTVKLRFVITIPHEPRRIKFGHERMHINHWNYRTRQWQADVICECSSRYKENVPFQRCECFTRRRLMKIPVSFGNIIMKICQLAFVYRINGNFHAIESVDRVYRLINIAFT